MVSGVIIICCGLSSSSSGHHTADAGAHQCGPRGPGNTLRTKIGMAKKETKHPLRPQLYVF
jgi:hypothetical protein